MDPESTEGRTLSLDLPAALDEWLTDRTEELDVDESELVLQLVGSYRVAADADDGTVAELAATTDEGAVDVEAAVREEVDAALAGATVDEDAIIRQTETRLSERADALEAEFDEKLDDVRRRVVQLKSEVGEKSSADHDHEAFERLDELAAGLDEIRAEMQKLQGTDEGDEDLAARVGDLEGKLDTLARVVVQLRDAPDDDGDEVLMEIKRTAARQGADEARCESCGETVSIGLLPEAECPHCRSPFDGLVEGSGGLFGSTPRLVGPGERGGTESDGDAGDGGAVDSELSGLGTDDGSGVDPAGDGDGAVSTDGGDR